jgi:16S rRNA A1518/A1519 N6-dimethyltransferase RsmA/KsgA/DIM1 with predicted DNA glycosylase/AP lyase activity
MKLKPKKSLGQHFLQSPSALQKIIEAANIKPGEIILEIGPGTGILTSELLKTGAKVIAIEKDERAFGLLKETIGDVTDLSAYYEYQLYCKHLHISITESIQRVHSKRKEKSETEWVDHILSNPDIFGEIQDRRETDRSIFTIENKLT